MKKLTLIPLAVFVFISMFCSSCKKEEEDVNLLLGNWVLIEHYDENGNKVQMTDFNGLTQKTQFKFNACEGSKCELDAVYTWAYNSQAVNYQTGETYKYTFDGDKELTILSEVYVIDKLNENDLLYHVKDNTKQRYEFYKF